MTIEISYGLRGAVEYGVEGLRGVELPADGGFWEGVGVVLEGNGQSGNGAPCGGRRYL